MRNFTTLLFCFTFLFSFEPLFSQTVTDIDGNVYNTVVIGTQEWTVENLITTKTNDGIPIPLVTDNTNWVNLTTPGYCLYENLTTNADVYGYLYNWFAVNTHKLCPTGWAVPTDAEWNVLIDFLGGTNEAGNKLKEAGTVHWAMNPGATNESGFTGLPGGQRGAYGVYDLLRGCGTFWSASEVNENFAGIYNLTLYGGLVQYISEVKGAGKSVRCLKGGVSGINNSQDQSIRFMMYPNPSESHVKIQYESSHEVTIQIFDAVGKKIIEKQFLGTTDIEILHKGIYFVQLIDDSKIKIEKLIIQ